MALLEKLWDDVVAGPSPERGLGKLRRLQTQNFNKDAEMNASEGKYQRSTWMPTGRGTAPTPSSPSSPSSAKKENVWRSVFHPGSNLNTRTVGAHIFDKPSQPTSPTVYDWLYSADTKSKHC